MQEVTGPLVPNPLCVIMALSLAYYNALIIKSHYNMPVYILWQHIMYIQAWYFTLWSNDHYQLWSEAWNVSVQYVSNPHPSIGRHAHGTLFIIINDWAAESLLVTMVTFIDTEIYYLKSWHLTLSFVVHCDGPCSKRVQHTQAYKSIITNTMSCN